MTKLEKKGSLKHDEDDFYNKSKTEINGPLSKSSSDIIGMSEQNMFRDAKEYKTEGGLKIIAGSDRGVNYKKSSQPNEDRVVISPQEELIAVIDGMGGRNGGDKAAQILAEELANNPSNPKLAALTADKKIKEELPGAAAVFTAIKFLRGKEKIYLQEFHAGDCFAMIIRGGKVLKVSDQETWTDALVKGGIITADTALYHSLRNIITNSVGGEKPAEIKSSFSEPNAPSSLFELERGDRILVMSDGICDNFTPEELLKLVDNLSLQEAMRKVDEQATDRMGRARLQIYREKRAVGGFFPDGYRSQPKGDNKSLVIIDV